MSLPRCCIEKNEKVFSSRCASSEGITNNAEDVAQPSLVRLGRRIVVRYRHSCFYLFRNYFYVRSSEWRCSFLYFLPSLSFAFFLTKISFFVRHCRSCSLLLLFGRFLFCYCFNLSPNFTLQAMEFTICNWRKKYRNTNRLISFFLSPAMAWILFNYIVAFDWNWTERNWADSKMSLFCGKRNLRIGSEPVRCRSSKPMQLLSNEKKIASRPPTTE